MNIFHVIILSIIEGITEFLPVSSTGHLILTSQLLNLSQTDYTKSFEIAIQSGAILAVVVLYGKVLLQDKELLKRVLIAFVPTGIIGFVLYKLIKQFLIGNVFITLVALLSGGILIICFERFFKKHTGTKEVKDLSYKESALVGIAQSISVIPGVSRSAATIYGGIFLGLTRKAAVELSFMLAVPTMFAATGYDLIKSIHEFNSSQVSFLIIGFIVSFVAALVAIKWFLNYVTRYTLIPFGIYRIVIAIIFLYFLK